MARPPLWTAIESVNFKDFVQRVATATMQLTGFYLATSLPSCKFVSVISDVTHLWTTTVLSDKLDISLRPSKSTGQTQLDVLRDVIVQTFLFVIRPVSPVLQVGTKIS